MAVRYVEIGQYPDVRREVRGNLSEILVATANPGAYATPEDVTGTFLEMGADGKWDGASVGSFGSIDELNALPTAYLATGARASVNGIQYTYGTAGWVKAGGKSYGKNIIAVLGDSIAAAAGSHLEQAIFRMGYRLAGKFAVAGSKIEDQSKKISAIKAAGADTVYIHVGANNWQDTGSQIFSKYVKLFGELYANGLRVVVSSPGPQGNSIQRITYKTVVACYYAAKQFDFQVIDALGIYSTENAGWQVGKSPDNLHPLAATRSEAADLFVSKLRSGDDSIPVIRSRTESLLANPCFALDTNADGLSDSWTKTGTVSGGTLVVARETDGALGHYKQTIKITNPTINDDQFVCQTLTPAAGYAPGDVLMVSMVYDYSKPADTDPAIVDPCGPMIQAQGTLYGFPQIYNGLYGAFNAPVTGAVATRQFVVDSTYTDVRISAGLRAVNTPPAGDYVLKIYRVGLVNLTALGIA